MNHIGAELQPYNEETFNKKPIADVAPISKRQFRPVKSFVNGANYTTDLYDLVKSEATHYVREGDTTTFYRRLETDLSDRSDL